ncbi:RNA-binding protein L-like [Phragmites australis]|uniref:RNA-binding protein L-like n=1 Tax=Phragmites australis TaxID=29695 RepID=UPI002D779621|nr:RNA-binding protein L-like [Phragmites australis]
MWGQQYAPPPQQYAPPPQQYAPPPQQYAPPPQQQYALPPPQRYAAPQYGTAPGSDDIRSVWIGDLQYWMDESYIYSAFAPMAQQIASVKRIRNKQSGHPEGYGFIEFQSRAAAEHTLMNFNGWMMPNVDQTFKLNWASATADDKRGDNGSDHTIFVGDLAADVTDSMLEEVFKASYPSVRGANVVTDRLTGRSKGYGFVRFGDLNAQTRAMTEMNGMMLSTRKMRIGPAANKKNMDAQPTYTTNGAYQSSQGNYSEDDPNNTTVFVGGLDSNVNEEYLRQVFTPYGEIGYVKIPVGKRCGFVQFTSRSSAEEAIHMPNGSQIGGQKVRLSWCRSPKNKKGSAARFQQPIQWQQLLWIPRGL